MNSLEASYQRSGRHFGVIHFGLGAFHRGHQAVYFDDALRNGVGEWGIYGISPRSSTVTDQLRRQNFLYTVNERQGATQKPRIVSSIFDGSLFESENPALIEAALSSELKMITVTVTEKAYVAGLDQRSMPNRLLDLLNIRFRQGLTAPTLISCDNLPENGSFLRNVLLQSASERKLDREFQNWVAALAIPDSMVDRIVPAITPTAIDEFEREFGYHDESLISTEPFRQWVVATHSSPVNLGGLGIEVSDDVASYEKMKLRLFNGAHSSTAYFSQLSNVEYVYQAMQIPAWQGFIEELQKELSYSFTPPSGVDLAIYSDLARSRIANSAVAHRSAQIAMDGSAKLPQRLFKAINALAQKNKPRERVAFAIALWIKFLESDLPLVDPLATDLRDRARRLEPVASVMQTPGLRDPVLESEWMLIDAHLKQMKRYAPIEIVGNF